MYTITYHLECPFISKSLEGLETEVAQPPKIFQKFFFLFENLSFDARDGAKISFFSSTATAENATM